MIQMKVTVRIQFEICSKTASGPQSKARLTQRQPFTLTPVGYLHFFRLWEETLAPERKPTLAWGEHAKSDRKVSG